jgi:hypothetical protein
VKSVGLTSIDKLALSKQDFFQQKENNVDSLGFACTGIIEKINNSTSLKECPFVVGDEVVGFLPPNCGGSLRDYICQYWFYFGIYLLYFILYFFYFFLFFWFSEKTNFCNS